MKKQRSAYEWKANSNDLEMTDKNNNIDDKIVRGYGEQALKDEAQAILDQIPYLDDNFEKAVDMMYHCQGKIIVTGESKSGHLGAKKSRFPAGKILQPSYHRKGKEGGLSAEPRPYQQYYCSIGYG